MMDEHKLRRYAGLSEATKNPEVNKKIEKTLKQMEKFLGDVSQDQNRGDLEEGFFEGYLSATEVWLKLLAKEFPGLRNKIK